MSHIQFSSLSFLSSNQQVAQFLAYLNQLYMKQLSSRQQLMDLVLQKNIDNIFEKANRNINFFSGKKMETKGEFLLLVDCLFDLLNITSCGEIEKKDYTKALAFQKAILEILIAFLKSKKQHE